MYFGQVNHCIKISTSPVNWVFVGFTYIENWPLLLSPISKIAHRTGCALDLSIFLKYDLNRSLCKI